jgi:lipoyl-dependent peroxiredoxin
MKILYRTSAVASGGRTGSARSEDGALSVKLDTPQSLGGSGGPGTNPEQMFAAGYAACFLSAIQLVARMSKVALDAESQVTANVGIGPADEGAGYALTVDLKAHLPGVDQETARGLIYEAHQICPYSNATRGNIDVELSAA